MKYKKHTILNSFETDDTGSVVCSVNFDEDSKYIEGFIRLYDCSKSVTINLGAYGNGTDIIRTLNDRIKKVRKLIKALQGLERFLLKIKR